MAAPRGLPVAGRRPRTGRGVVLRARWGSKVSYWLSRWGAWAARTRRPRTQRQLLLNARERLRLVGRFVPTKRAHRHPPSPAAVFARESAPPRGAPLVKRRRREGSFAKSSPRNDERRARAFN